MSTCLQVWLIDQVVFIVVSWMTLWFLFLFILWIEINIVIFDHPFFTTILCHYKAPRIILLHIFWLLRDIHGVIIAATAIARFLISCKFCVLTSESGTRLRFIFLLTVLLVTHFKLYSFLLFRLCHILLPLLSVFNWWLSVFIIWWIINFLLFIWNRKIIFLLLINRVTPSSWYQHLLFLLLHISFISNSY